MKKKIIECLSKDKVLAELIDKYDLDELKKRDNIYLVLIRSIMSQQISTKAAESIYKRFIELFSSETPSLLDVQNLDFNTLKGVGLSRQKTNYIFNIVQFFIDNKLNDKHIFTLSSQEIIDLFIQIKGVGKWTIEMILIFSLAREDIFAEDDLGLQIAMMNLYKWKSSLTKKEVKTKMTKQSLKWHPYQTYACLLLWKWKNNYNLSKKVKHKN